VWECFDYHYDWRALLAFCGQGSGLPAMKKEELSYFNEDDIPHGRPLGILVKAPYSFVVFTL
jgi:hypothetical protein